ncbi:tripartite motif-containing protein 14-like [Lampetra fluviatilis]
MASDFSCSICLELFKVPVSLSCGHSFCKSCIESHWAVQSAKARLTCPECREIYYQKPKLSKNILLANIVADLNQINIVPRPGRRCKRHGQGLGLYCKTDTQLICVGCMGDHRRHDIVPVKAQRGEKAGQLSSMMQQLSMREETETSIVSGLVDSTKTVEAAAEQTKGMLSGSYDELLRLISEDKASALRAIDKERDLKLLEIRQEIEKNQATLCSLTEALSRIRSLEETEDPVEFLEGCTLHWASFASLGCQRTEPRRPSSPLGFEEAAVPLQKRIDELLRSFKASACAPGGTLALHRSPKTPRGGGGGTGASEAAAAAATPAPRGIEAAGTSGGPAVAPSGLNRAFLIRSYARSLTLDTNSAHDLLQVSLDLRMVTRTGVSQHRPHHPHRFDLYPQSLCRESFSSGRHYWEVDVEGAESCRVGVVYGMIPRKGRDAACRLGGGDASWSLVKDRDCFSVRHAGEATPLLVAALPQRVGVHLDWEGGVLQFYREDTGDILCTLHHRFTQPLFPALGVWRVGDSVSIVDFP